MHLRGCFLILFWVYTEPDVGPMILLYKETFILGSSKWPQIKLYKDFLKYVWICFLYSSLETVVNQQKQFHRSILLCLLTTAEHNRFEIDNQWLLTLNVLCISESFIEIKIKLNFYFHTCKQLFNLQCKLQTWKT